MFKFLVLGVFLWQEVVKDVYGQAQAGAVDTKTPLLSAINPSKKNNTSKGLNRDTDGKYSFHASQQTFYLQGPHAGTMPSKNNDSSKGLTLEADENYTFHASKQTFYLQDPYAEKTPIGFTGNFRDDGWKVGADYLVTNGMGAHKVHIRKLSWNKARRICIEEGGHLAIIRSESEEKILQRMMNENSIEVAWVGYHDLFAEGDWVTVLDEPIGQTGWARWSKKFPVNPDNFEGIQHCAQFLKTGGGIDDVGCGFEGPFICKVSLV